jgi:hypothetical protein
MRARCSIAHRLAGVIFRISCTSALSSCSISRKENASPSLPGSPSIQSCRILKNSCFSARERGSLDQPDIPCFRWPFLLKRSSRRSFVPGILFAGNRESCVSGYRPARYARMIGPSTIWRISVRRKKSLEPCLPLPPGCVAVPWQSGTARRRAHPASRSGSSSGLGMVVSVILVRPPVQQGLHLFTELIDIPELTVNRRKTHIGDLVNLMQASQHHLTDSQ